MQTSKYVHLLGNAQALCNLSALSQQSMSGLVVASRVPHHALKRTGRFLRLSGHFDLCAGLPPMQ
jgi:hypothetical protein